MHTISYLPETDININDDLITRKEFLLFKQNIDKISHSQDKNDSIIIPRFDISKNIPESNYLEFTSYQLFIRNYFNPNTPYSRLLLKWQTGFGKTIGALSVAMNFIQYYQRHEKELHIQLGSIYVIGFTRNIFKLEMLNYPEFGFISREELAKLKLMKKNASTRNPGHIDILRKYLNMLRKRFSNRIGNGFFKFIGYKELANHLFIFDEKNSDDMRDNLINMSANELRKNIDNGTIKINKPLLKEFENSLIICDEIHNVYNTFEKNNWGVALQAILNYHSSCRALFLSATPLNNSPTEVIDLLNLLLPRQYYPILDKDDFFEETHDNVKLKLSKEPIIVNYLKGRISFIRDNNPQFMASKTFIGESIPGIDYLKFIRCPMSKFQYNTYKTVVSDNIASPGQDGQYLVDFVIPDPTAKQPLSINTLGLYTSKDIKEKYGAATDAWKVKYGISYNNTNEIIQGRILKSETLAIISNKYYTMLETLITDLQQNKGKTFIYHNYIHMTGILFIQEILLQNHIIGEYDNSTDDTLCICGKIRKLHTKEQISPTNLDVSEKTIPNYKKIKNSKTHPYQPVRFAIVHSNLDNRVIAKTLENFNNSNNIRGSRLMILIGSRIMKESHSLIAVRNVFIMSRPDNIPSLIQIIGRVLRLNAYKSLPIAERHVEIRLFVSSIPKSDISKKHMLSYEESKYMKKIKTFKVIQYIEKLMHENAIDAYFNYDKIWNSNYNASDDFGLNILPYSINYKSAPASLTLDELNLSTFNAYHAKFEVTYITYIIKRLFIEISPVWKYKDLFNAVKSPTFDITINTDIISQDLFNIALNNILYNESSSIYVEPIVTDLVDKLVYSNVMDKLHNPDDKIIIVLNNIKYVIIHIGEMYSMVPIRNNEIFIDNETVYRSISYTDTKYTNIIQYLKYDSQNDYIDKKIRFINKWKFTEIIDLEQSLCDFGTKFHISFLEEIVKYMFNVWTLPDQKKDENHAFYLKMIYFYDLQKLIAWAHLLDKTLTKKYSVFVIPITLKITKNSNIDFPITSSPDNQNNNNILISTINRDDKAWISTNMIKAYNNNLHESEKLFDNIYKKTKKHTKVNADLLPVGHYLEKTSRFYHPDSGWFDYTTAIDNKTIKENDIIIGYDKRSKTGLSIKFKLRNPIQKIKKYQDTRLIEKGTTCSTKSKSFLLDIAKKLGIHLTTNELNSSTICYKIRSKLIYLELKERQKNTNIKYFYNVLEIKDI